MVISGILVEQLDAESSMHMSGMFLSEIHLMFQTSKTWLYGYLSLSSNFLLSQMEMIKHL